MNIVVSNLKIHIPSNIYENIKNLAELFPNVASETVIFHTTYKRQELV